MSDARSRVLGAVRSSLVRAILPDATADLDPAVAAAGRPAEAAPDRSALVAAFAAALTALKGHLHYAATAADVPGIVAAIARDAGASSFVSWDEDAIACPGLLAAMASQGLRRVTYDVPSADPARSDLLRDLGGVVLGITGADAALADSGALVLISGPGRGRLVSALPPVHVAVLPADRVWPDLGTVLAGRPGLCDEASHVVCVAGPSRTADIEMTLTHGVHGPIHLHVVVIG